MSWALVTTPSGIAAPGEQLQAVASDGAGTWVVASNQGNVWTSADNGATWSGPRAVNSDLTGVAGLQFLDGLFYAWGFSNVTGIDIFTSPDGVTWTERASELNLNAGLTSAFQGPSLAWNGTNLFVLVGTQSGGGTSATSPDGVTWTLHNTYNPASGQGFVACVWDGARFVAIVIDSGKSPNYQLATSTDGATWTFQALNTVPGPDGALQGIYSFLGSYIVGNGYDSTANGGLGQGWFEIGTSTGPWNGAAVDVNSSPVGIDANVLTADNGSIALGCGVNPNSNDPFAITTTDGATFNIEDALFPSGGTIEWIAAGATGFMAVGIDGSSNPVVSFRSGDVTVPNVVGDTQAVATAAITAAGLMVGSISSAFNSGVAAGLVFVQAPTAGSSVAPGSAVNFTLSLGPQEVVVPDLIGLTGTVAENTLASVGLTTGAVTGVSSTTIPVGSVATQNPDPGAVVLFGSAVDVGISFVVPEFDVDATVISQYANSPTIVALVEDFGQWFDPSANLQSFYLTVWDIDTAVGFGLDIWGIILGVSRVIPIPGTSGAFGFENSDSPPDWENFGNIDTGLSGGPFFSGQVSGGSYRLDDGPYRTLLLTQALANICATTAPALNALITNLFPGRGRCYTRDLGSMEMSYFFEFPLTTIELAILEFSGVLAHPGGVGVSINVVPEGFFGFQESGPTAQTFDFGVFFNGS